MSRTYAGVTDNKDTLLVVASVNPVTMAGGGATIFVISSCMSSGTMNLLCSSVLRKSKIALLMLRFSLVCNWLVLGVERGEGI